MSDPNKSEEQQVSKPLFNRTQRVIIVIGTVFLAFVLVTLFSIIVSKAVMLAEHDNQGSDDQISYPYRVCDDDQIKIGEIYNIFSDQNARATEEVDFEHFYPSGATCLSREEAVRIGNDVLPKFNKVIVDHNAWLDEYIADYKAKAAAIDGDLAARVQQLVALNCSERHYPNGAGAYWFSNLASFDEATLDLPPFGYDGQVGPDQREPQLGQIFPVGKYEPAAYEVSAAETARLLAPFGEHLSYTC